MFEELHAAGMTEWLGRVFPFGELMPQIGSSREAEHADRLFLVCSLTTDRPGGYLESDMAVLKQVLPLFALAAKAVTMRAIGQGLLAAYLGDDPASRVFAGTVQRGEVQSVDAIVFFTDLRGFTALADVTPGKELIALLDECFDCMVAPVVKRGGEVLKFMGDGLLAAFAARPATRAEACSAALDAATEALALIDGLNERRRAAGRPGDRTRYLAAPRHGAVRQCRHRRAARLHGDRAGGERGVAHRETVRAARPQPPDLAVLRRSGDLLPGPPGLARPPPPARRARGGGAVRPGVMQGLMTQIPFDGRRATSGEGARPHAPRSERRSLDFKGASRSRSRARLPDPRPRPQAAGCSGSAEQPTAL